MTRRKAWPRKIPYALRVALLILWMALIFLLSADSDSGATSGGVLEALLGVLGALTGPLGPDAQETLHLLLRKAAHFTEYAVLALLWTGVLPRGKSRLLLAFLLTTAYAVSDEIHQAFVPNRGPSPFDVLIDAAGAFTALAGLWLCRERHLDPVTKFH